MNVQNDGDSPSNIAEYSVSELSASIRRTIEGAFEHVRLRGEVSGYRGPHSSGHAYFSLKDERARIDAVIWKTTFARLKFRPEEGLEVIATGRITTFPGSSKYQIVIESLEPAGAGALMALLEERRQRLAAQGLFDDARKRPLPFLPKVVGVVTSPTGAVIRDILHRINDRFPLHVVVWPVKVQGEGSGDDVAAAIRGFNALTEGGAIARPDVLIVARGGGSLEDLWSFNDEAVVRAAAASAIPLISAVGHETDWTLIDHAADIRAPTPTAAAEIAVPVKAELAAELAGLAARLHGATSRQMDLRRQGLKALMRALPSLDQLLAMPRRRSDEASARLGRALERTALVKRRALEQVSARLRPDMLTARIGLWRQSVAERVNRIARVVERDLLAARGRVGAANAVLRAFPARLGGEAERARERVTTLSRRADTAIATVLAQRRMAISAQDRVLESLSYRNVLKRGYAVIRDPAGDPLTRAAGIAAGTAITVEFSDAGIAAVTTSGEEPAAPAPTASKRRGPKPPSGQGSLF